MEQLDTPILFLVFNRPAPTRQVFERIREQRPKQLFIAADGPRHNREQEADICRETRELVLQNIDWPCEVHTLFRENNLGCGRAVSGAIDWFFTYVEYGIILEDDCVPDPTFFYFCSTLLSHFRYDNRIMHIGGSNYQMGQTRGVGSYYFSRYAHIWGWATWKRAWRQYDFTLNRYKTASQEGLPGHYRADMRSILENRIDTWDIQWFLSVWFSGGWVVTPNTNLVRNIGYGKGATHTHSVPMWFKRMVYGSIPFIWHTADTEPDAVADDFMTRTLFKTASLKYQVKKIVHNNNLLHQLYKRIT
jgi:hypothetical protein